MVALVVREEGYFHYQPPSTEIGYVQAAGAHNSPAATPNPPLASLTSSPIPSLLWKVVF